MKQGRTIVIITLFLIFIFSNYFISCNQPFSVDIQSPDGKISMALNTSSGFQQDQLTYDVFFNDFKVIKDSPLGFEFSDGRKLHQGFKILEVVDSVIEEDYSMPFGMYPT